jgi:predicted membrane chloride channel (bestrophin family)
MAKVFTLVFLLTLPAALVEDLGWHTVTATFILSLGYLGLDAIGNGSLALQFTCHRETRINLTQNNF